MIAIATAIAVVGCSGSGTPGGTSALGDSAPATATAEAGDLDEYDDDAPPAENPHLASDICALVSLESVAGAVGGTASETESTGDAPARCRYLYRLPEGTGSRQAAATIQMLNDYELERIAAGDRAVGLEGLGDEAWAHELPDVYILYVRRGNLVFRVEMGNGPLGFDPPTAARAVAELVLGVL